MDNIKNDEYHQLAKELTSKLTIEEKLYLLTTHHHPVERLNMGEFYIGQEVARGYVGRSPERYSTVFPQPIGLAATFDTELMERLGEIAADECRAYYNESKTGGICVWGPTVDMERHPLWGRTEEAYGEDVFLAGEMTAAYTRTLAGDNGKYLKTIPTLKHFCANNNEKHRVSCNAYIPLRLKYEYYYAAFMNAIRFGGAKSVMTAYNSINGVPAMCNPEVRKILKEQWGLWFAVTDGADFSQTVMFHKYCEKHSEALAEAFKAGVDTMTDYDELVYSVAKKALENGVINESDINESVENTLYARVKLGQFDENCPYNNINKDIVDCESHRAVNRRAAKEQVVLLKNNGLLPLQKAKKIAVLGPLANENFRDWYTGVFREAISIKDGIAAEFPKAEIVFDNLWTVMAIKASNGKYLSVKEDGSVKADAENITDSELFEFQEWGENWNNLFSVKYKKYLRFDGETLKLHNKDIYDWFTRETLNFDIVYYHGDEFYIISEYLSHKHMVCDSEGNISFKANVPVCDESVFKTCYSNEQIGNVRAERIVEECDYVIYCTGNHPVQTAKECHDRKNLSINKQVGIQFELFEKNKNFIMVVVSSYPYEIVDENNDFPAILCTSHAGPYLGTAIAETLSGKNNPAGRLAMTWYGSEADLPDIMEYDIEKSGATYMYFKGTPLYPFGYGLSYSKFEYSNFSLTRTEKGVLASLDVKNISEIDGDEVVQIYFTVENSAVSRPIKKLCGFARINIKAGKARNIVIEIPEHILQIYDTHSGEMITESGLYNFMTGSSSADIKLTQKLEILAQSIGLRDDKFEAQSFDGGYNVCIGYSRKYLKHVLKTEHGDGKAVYSGVNLKNKKLLKMTALSILDKVKITAEIDDFSKEITIYPADSYDDFTEYTIELPKNLPDSGELSLVIPSDVSVMEICFE